MEYEIGKKAVRVAGLTALLMGSGGITYAMEKNLEGITSPALRQQIIQVATQQRVHDYNNPICSNICDLCDACDHCDTCDGICDLDM